MGQEIATSFHCFFSVDAMMTHWHNDCLLGGAVEQNVLLQTLQKSSTHVFLHWKVFLKGVGKLSEGRWRREVHIKKMGRLQRNRLLSIVVRFVWEIKGQLQNLRDVSFLHRLCGKWEKHHLQVQKWSLIYDLQCYREADIYVWSCMINSALGEQRL